MRMRVRVTLITEQVCVVTYGHGGALQVHLRTSPGVMKLIWERPSNTSFRYISEEADQIAAEAIRVANARRKE